MILGSPFHSNSFILILYGPILIYIYILFLVSCLLLLVFRIVFL